MSTQARNLRLGRWVQVALNASKLVAVALFLLAILLALRYLQSVAALAAE